MQLDTFKFSEHISVSRDEILDLPIILQKLLKWYFMKLRALILNFTNYYSVILKTPDVNNINILFSYRATYMFEI